MSNHHFISNDWPAIAYAEWKSAEAVLQVYLQIVGKCHLARSSWVNHFWYATLTSRRFLRARSTTSAMAPISRSLPNKRMSMSSFRMFELAATYPSSFACADISSLVS